MHRVSLTCLALILCISAPVVAGEPELVSVKQIWDKAPHNAFTDLIRFEDRWVCVFREAEDHVGGDGRIRVLASKDGQQWASAALLAEDGIDLRDPKISIMPDGRLMIVAGGSVYGGTRTLKSRQPRVAFSQDGHTWTETKRILSEGDWLWRVTWHGDTGYGVSYRTEPRTDESGNETSDWLVSLYSTEDGREYEFLRDLRVADRPNETTLRFTPEGEMIALMRREGGNRHGMIGASRPPYTEWTWRDCGHRLGGPNFIRLPNGDFWAASRSYPGGAKTVLARMTRHSYEPVLTLPSGGDTSYPGLVWHEGLLWMSYYSSHEGKTSIYLAKIRLPID